MPHLGEHPVPDAEISWPVMVTGRPVGGRPNSSKGPVLVAVPLPENLAVNAVLWKFLWQFYSAVQDWAEWATAEAARWPHDLQPTAETQAWAMELFRAAEDGSADAAPTT